MVDEVDHAEDLAPRDDLGRLVFEMPRATAPWAEALSFWHMQKSDFHLVADFEDALHFCNLDARLRGDDNLRHDKVTVVEHEVRCVGF